MRTVAFRIRFFIGIGTLALLFFGFIKIQEAIRFSHRTDITFDQFLQQRPKEGWFHIHGGILRAAASVWKQTESNNIKTAYVPVRGTIQKDGKPIYLVVATHDPQILETVNTMKEMGDNAQAARDYGSKNPSKIFVQRDFEGMVLSGLDNESEIRTMLSTTMNNPGDSLDSDFVILEENKQPSIALGIGMLVGGIVLVILQVLYYARRRAIGSMR